MMYTDYLLASNYSPSLRDIPQRRLQWRQTASHLDFRTSKPVFSRALSNR